MDSLRSVVGLHNLNLLLGEPVEFVDELIDLVVGGVHVGLKVGFLIK